jgi:hypothetical protein
MSRRGEASTRLLDEPTPLRVSDRLEPVMRTQLAIYVV